MDYRSRLAWASLFCLLGIGSTSVASRFSSTPSHFIKLPIRNCRLQTTVSNMKVQELRKALQAHFDKAQFDFTKIGIDTNLDENYLVKDGISFFPYGRGLLTSGDEIPKDCVLFLGSDWGTLEYAHKVVSAGKGEETNPTIRNLRKLVDKENESRVFLSNVFIGLRTQGTNTATYPAFQNKEYCEINEVVFRTQIELIKPRKIVALGQRVEKFLAENLHGFDIEVQVIPHPSLLPTNLSKSIKKKESLTDVSKERIAKEIEQIKKRIWK